MSLPAESNSLDVLPPVLRHGLRAVVVLASLSLISSSWLFSHLSFKLLQYCAKKRRARARALQENQTSNARPISMDLELVLEQGTLASASKRRNVRSPTAASETQQYPPPNQFVVLFHSLLLADLHQAIAFFLNAVWVARDEIVVGSPTCWTQGLFISNGDLASSCFIFTIALHTYMSVVREYKPPQWALYAWIVGTWIFVYCIGFAGIVFTNNGKEVGGYFVRASAWVSSPHLPILWSCDRLTGNQQCWINEEYERLRLVTHYLYIFLSIVFTSFLYILIFFKLRARLTHKRDGATPSRGQDSRPPLRHKTSMLSVMSSSSSFSSSQTSSADSPPSINADHHPAFLIYPLIYVLCTMPLAIGRIAAMTGIDVPLAFFCAAGALIVSNGWLDVLLWGTTRHTIVFGRLEDADALGLDTFDFMRTPSDRRFGNFVWVQGASDMQTGRPDGSARRSRPWWTRVGKPLGMGGSGVGNGSRSDPRGVWEDRDSETLARPDDEKTYRLSRTNETDNLESSNDQSSVCTKPWNGRPDMGMNIQMDRVVTIVKEDSFTSSTSNPAKPGSSYSVRAPEKDGYF